MQTVLHRWGETPWKDWDPNIHWFQSATYFTVKFQSFGPNTWDDLRQTLGLSQGENKLQKCQPQIPKLGRLAKQKLNKIFNSVFSLILISHTLTCSILILLSNKLLNLHPIFGWSQIEFIYICSLNGQNRNLKGKLNIRHVSSFWVYQMLLTSQF